MFPVLFTIGNISVSSFGVFLATGFLVGLFLVWRLCRAWDLDEEKTLDLTLLTFLGGLIGARLYFVTEHLQLFASSPLSVILINRIPGFSFWGGVLSGWLTLYFLARRYKMDFWQLADIAVVGLLGGLIFADMGCFFGSCNIGIPSKAFFSVTQVGFIGKRWPVQIVEAFALFISLFKVWSEATRFHQRGKIASLGFIYIGVIKLIFEPFRQDHTGLFFSIILILLGFTIYYRITRQNPINHLQSLSKLLIGMFTDSQTRIQVVQSLGKTWYNQKTGFGWKLRNLKKVLRRFNVKLS